MNWSKPMIKSVSGAMILVTLALGRAFCHAGTPVSPEMNAKLRALFQELKARKIAEVVTNAQHNRGNLLHLTLVPNSDDEDLVVGENGLKTSSRSDPFGEGRTWQRKLSEEDLLSIRLFLDQLPKDNATSSSTHTVVIGFRSGTNWLARVYDMKHQPYAFQRLRQVIDDRNTLKEPDN